MTPSYVATNAAQPRPHVGDDTPARKSVRRDKDAKVFPQNAAAKLAELCSMPLINKLNLLHAFFASQFSNSLLYYFYEQKFREAKSGSTRVGRCSVSGEWREK